MKPKEFRKYEKYALVTGAASGMGRLYTIRLALMGYNVIPVDINKEGLDCTCRMAKDQLMALEGMDDSLRHDFKMLPLVQDLSERDANGKPVFKTKDIIAEISSLSKVHEELKILEGQVKKEMMETSSIRGGATDGFLPNF